MLQKQQNEEGSIFYPVIFPQPQIPERLGLYLSGAGELNSRGAFSFAIIPDRFVLTYIHAGCGTIVTSGQEYQAQKGELYLFWPEQHYVYADLPEHPWQYTWIWLEGPCLHDALTSLGLSPEDVVLSPKHRGGAMGRFFKQTLDRIQRRDYTPARVAAMAWECIDHLAQQLSSDELIPANIADATRLMIEERYREPITIEQLADIFEVERTTLFRQFKRHFQVSPKQFLCDVRLRKAAEFLQHTHWSVKQVARECGFTDPCYFSRVFAEHYGCNPSQWRD